MNVHELSEGSSLAQGWDSGLLRIKLSRDLKRLVYKGQLNSWIGSNLISTQVKLFLNLTTRRVGPPACSLG